MYIPVIYYHSIALGENPHWIKKYLTLELKYFEAQMKYLKKNRYETIFLDEYFDILKNGNIENKKCVCITFDDGFLDNWIYAFPILKNNNFKATIFVNPEFVDTKASVRKTLISYWAGNTTIDSIDKWGYLSWEEMSLMEASGLIDIQSHTMSHAELFISDKIVDFHHPASQCLYPIGNLFPDRKPYYIEDMEFEKLLPYGYPFFEFSSSVIARKVEINPDFINDVVRKLGGNDWTSGYRFDDLYRQIEPLYTGYLKDDRVIVKRESDEEYNNRLLYELKASKDLIEKNLNKQVRFLCWPNHDYNDYVHQKAKEIGYKASVVVLNINEKRQDDRFDRVSIVSMRINKFQSRFKARLKLIGLHRIFPLNYIFKYSQAKSNSY